MKWNLKNHPQNISNASWTPDWWVMVDKISSATVSFPRSSDTLHPYDQYVDGGSDAFSRRWRLVVDNLPDTAHWGRRTVQTMFTAVDDQDLDGSTFGLVSVWEHSPPIERPDQLALEVDFAKVRSQGHELGLHVTIYHNTANVRSEISDSDD